MDNPLLFKIVEETVQQCRFAGFSFQSLRTGLQGADAQKSFFWVHSFLHYGQNVSRMLWPDRKESSQRGEKLREIARADTDSPSRLNQLGRQQSRFDESFEDWCQRLGGLNYVDMNIMPQGTIGSFQSDTFQRNLDPEEYIFVYQGASFDLRLLADELKRIDGACQQWLRTNNPW